MDRDTRSDTADGIAVPEFSFPEDAVRALGHAARYSQWRQRPLGTIRSARDDQRSSARAIIEQALADRKEWLSPADLTALFDCYGLPLVPTRAVTTATAAVGAAAELGYPVVLKAIAPGLLHKSDAGGVRVGLAGPGAVAGYRGAPACDLHAVEDVLVQLSAMVDAHPEIAELDANPTIVSSRGALIVDARVRVQEATPTAHYVVTAPK